MKVVVVAEFYPREHDPVLGIWAHRQAVAAQAAGAEVEVLVLHRVVPPLSSLKAGPRAAFRAWRTLLRQPRHSELDGLPITYVPFISPSRTGSYGAWGKSAARPLARALRKLHARFPYDIVHAHNAVPAADALRRSKLGKIPKPLITSVHGGDVFHTAPLRPDWALNVTAGLNASDLVLANSSGIKTACRRLTTSPVEVMLLGADVPDRDPRPPRDHTLITVAHLIERKRHADVIRAMWVLRVRWPKLRYVIVGDGPERAHLEALAAELEMSDRIQFRGQLAPAEAMEAVDHSTLAVMPSVNEAYGVAYVETMARGVPTIAALGEPGPLDLADLGSGIQLAAPGDVEHLARVIDRLLTDPAERTRLGKIGRRVMRERCSWEVVGRNTVDVYTRVIGTYGGAGEFGAATTRRATSGSPTGASRMTDPSRPVLFVTTEVPPDRVGAFRALAELIPIELALFGGGLHATAGVDDHGVPARHVTQREVYGLAASGRYAAVVAGTVGRTALPAAWLGAERARVPFIVWTALWAHPRSLAHLPGAALLRVLFPPADGVVTYGPHVSRFAERHGAKATVVAPQAVDGAFWTVDGDVARDATGPPRLVFVGRDDPGKGVDWLLRAWDHSELGALRPAPGGATAAEEGRGLATARPEAELRLIGADPSRSAGHDGVTALGPLAPAGVREELAAATAIVVPSERTATFREPWGLVVNEAMHAGALVIASTEVGAVAGGLVQDGRTGLVVPAGNMNALAAAMRRAVAPEAPEIRAIRANGRQAVSSYTHAAWASAFAGLLTRSVA